MADASSCPADSRWIPWGQVVAGHLINFNTFGFIGSWGIFESYYTDALSQSASTISWIGSIQIFIVYFLSTFSGRALDAGYLYYLMRFGCLLQIVGVLTSSWASQYWQLFLSQGLCQGIGNGLVFCPVISTVSIHHNGRTRAIAVGLASLGAAIGGIIFPIIAKELLPRIGIGWTLRVMALIMAVNAVIANLLVRKRTSPVRQGRLIDWRAFKETPYLLYAIGTFSGLWGIYFAFYYITVFGTSVVHISENESFLFVLTLNLIGLFGRTIPAWVSRAWAGPLYMLSIVTLLSGLLLYTWILVSDLQGLIAFTVTYGFFANAVQSLFLGGVGYLVSDEHKMGSRMGMIFSIVSFSSLTGPPIAGALISMDDGGFLYAQIFGGTAMVVGGAALLGAARAQQRQRATNDT